MMAAADYILCDKCYGKIVYDADDNIFEALTKLGFSGLPIRCGRCSDKDNLMFSYRLGGEEEHTVRPSNRKDESAQQPLPQPPGE